MSSLRPRYARIDQVVASILADNRVFEPPVPVEKIATRAGVHVRRGKLGEVSGLLVRSVSEFIIGVNEEQAPTRQRFTIAHELGHFLLHENLHSHVDQGFAIRYRAEEASLGVNVHEIEANFFAASLLMPKSFLERDEAIRFLDDDKGVAFLAKKYKVSPHAMSLRLGNCISPAPPVLRLLRVGRCPICQNLRVALRAAPSKQKLEIAGETLRCLA